MPKHIPNGAFDDAHAALKVGGIFILTLRENLWETGQELGYKDKIDELIEDGKMEIIKTETF